MFAFVCLVFVVRLLPNCLIKVSVNEVHSIAFQVKCTKHSLFFRASTKYPQKNMYDTIPLIKLGECVGN